MKKVLVYFLILFLSANVINAENYPVKKVLVVVEGDYNLKSFATAYGRQMAELLGHFKTTTTIIGVTSYKPHDIDKYDDVFYIGFSANYQVSPEFSQDIFTTSKPVVWLNSGFEGFCKHHDVQGKFGFSVSQYEKNIPFASVKAGNLVFTKGTRDLNLVQVSNKAGVEVWATAISVKPKKEMPYMVKSKNLTYVADLPFVAANETDRYLLFSEKLHDILGENHQETHKAIIRIEDVTPLHDPNKLREIADIFAERGEPFLVGVVPIYVNPGEDRRVTLTDRPELVDALKYMVRNGGSIVMHGVTHQYKGISTDDCEFWDGNNAKPIPGENSEDFGKKLELGIDEFFKNGLYPIAWETPHYEASVKAYETFAKYFGTVVEQRMAIDNFDYGQYFPYIIEKDIYGQKIYPENLGYVPLNPNPDSSRSSVNRILKNAGMIHQVRDGIVSCFFHPFLDLNLLKELIDGLKSQGFSFVDLSNDVNWVRSREKIVLTGSQSFKLNIDNSYLHEAYTDEDGNITKKIFSPDRFKGILSKDITLKPGEYYIAEGVDYQIKEPTWKDKLIYQVRNTYNDIFEDKNWHEARVNLCWNPSAKGAAFYDQSSLAAIFKSVNIGVDTIFLGQDLDLKTCNLLVVPYSCVDSLTYFERNDIVRFVKNGGKLITDRKNKLIERFGIKFLNSEMKLHLVRDKYFPEEFISWKYSQLANKFEYDENDEILCEDAATGLPVVLGKEYGKGKVLYFNTAFDPNTTLGYSYYPYALEYVKRYLQLSPVFKRENLEVFFDPAQRKNTSVENLVKLWVKQGIRVIHIGGWNDYKKYTYDYKRLISLAHANGLLVYAWLEPPYVSEKFWQNHPEWQEKNYKGEVLGTKDSNKASWRFNVSLTDENCLKAVISEYTSFLKNYDWDGVNLAELYFEAGKDFSEPEKFSPMHPSALAEFKKKYGFDMRQIFNPASDYYWEHNPKAKGEVIKYRVDKITEFHDRFLKAFTDISKAKPGLGIMVTFMDTYFSPEIIENQGVSSDAMIALQNKYNFLMNVEDPASKWSTTPTRYYEMGKYYSQKMKDPSKLMVDLNIYELRNREDVTPFPTVIQTGIESYHLVNSASSGAPRFTIYAEGTCNPQDIAFFSYASSGQVEYEYTDDGYEVSSPVSFLLQLPASIKVISVDGQQVIGYRDNLFLIPAGDHTVNYRKNDLPGFSTVELQPQILSFTGNLLDIKYGMRNLSFNYESTERAIVSVNRNPTSLKIDGKDVQLDVLKGNDCFSVILPFGKHTVEIITGDKLSYGINVTSLWSISAIAIYGTLAVIMLVIMYLGLKVVRKRLEN
jgi:uncharacterized protein YdaL